jgi:hypothetical protein
VKYPDRWPLAYCEAINQLALVIAANSERETNFCVFSSPHEQSAVSR